MSVSPRISHVMVTLGREEMWVRGPDRESRSVFTTDDWALLKHFNGNLGLSVDFQRRFSKNVFLLYYPIF